MASLEVLNRVKNKKVNGFISALSVPVLYFLRKLPDREAREKVKKITIGFNIINLTSEIIENAMNDTEFNDFEDAIQFYSAINANVEIIITRNKRHFRCVENKIKVVTPEEFLEEFKE
ncbi:MAG: type II toxin-antitoxin system VapC family toxin [Methanosarcinales archaeon]